MQCVVLAGGLGTRMGRWTSTTPKALIPVAGVPFVRHQLGLLANSGVSDVLILTGHLGEMIEQEISDRPFPRLTVQCLADGPQLLGTAGALRRASAKGLLDERFFVLYGDSYLEIDYQSVWAAFDPLHFKALMTVLHNDEDLDHSNAAFDGGVVTMYRKGVEDPASLGLVYVDYGLSVVTRATLDDLVAPSQVTDLGMVFGRLAESGELQGYQALNRFYEVGSEQGLIDLEAHLQPVGPR
jgi:MurNAc alpha-1-phosphate uridylyltransferase